MFSSACYVHSPVWAQELAIGVRSIARGLIREGTRYRNILRDVCATQWLSSDEFATLQRDRLIAIVRHAAANVPYYSALFARNKWSPMDVRSIDDIKYLPYLTKREVLADPKAFVATNMRGLRFRIHSSGTTGAPITIYQNLMSMVREHAFISRHFSWAGFKLGERRAWMRGDLVVPVEQTRGPFWRFDRVTNTLMLSSYHVTEANTGAYVQALESFDPVLIQAYPSSLALLARVMEDRGRSYQGSHLRAIITSSETLDVTARSVIECRFGCRVFDHYGSAERTVLIGTCEQGRYHIEPDYGFTELSEMANGDYELVGTGFNNWLMPLIRYKSGDCVDSPTFGSRCDCGREMPTVQGVAGRSDDYVVTPSGRRIGRLDHVFKGLRGIVEAQIRQVSLDEIRVLVCAGDGFSDASKARLAENIQSRIGGGVKIDVQIVPVIPRGKNGKFRAVVVERAVHDAFAKLSQRVAERTTDDEECMFGHPRGGVRHDGVHGHRAPER